MEQCNNSIGKTISIVMKYYIIYEYICNLINCFMLVEFQGVIYTTYRELVIGGDIHKFTTYRNINILLLFLVKVKYFYLNQSFMINLINNFL